MSQAYRSALEQSWVANAAGWTQAVREERIESRRLATNAAIVDALLEAAPRRVLDLGCGEGWLVRKLAACGMQAIGVDGSAPLVNAARAAGGTFLQLSYEDVVTDPAQAGQDFDAIVFNFALLEQDLLPLLRAVKGLLAEDGQLFIQTVHPWTACGDQPYRDGWRTENFEQFGAAFPEPMPWYYRTLTSWIKLMHDSGYRIVQLREPSHPHSGLPLSLLMICVGSQA